MDLIDDLWLVIFEYLRLSYLLKLKLVNKKLKNLISLHYEENINPKLSLKHQGLSLFLLIEFDNFNSRIDFGVYSGISKGREEKQYNIERSVTKKWCIKGQESSKFSIKNDFLEMKIDSDGNPFFELDIKRRKLIIYKILTSFYHFAENFETKKIDDCWSETKKIINYWNK